MADPKYMRKIQGMCRCQDCGLMADNADIDVELDCDKSCLSGATRTTARHVTYRPATADTGFRPI